MGSKYDASNLAYSTIYPNNGSSGFIIDLRNNWNNYTDPKSTLNVLYQQEQMYQVNVYQNMGNLKTGAQKAMDPSVINNAKNSLLTATNFATQMTNIKNNVYDYIDTADKVVNAIKIAFAVYYAVSILCVALMVLGGIFLCGCKCEGCKCFSNIGWFLLSFLMIIGFLFSTLVWPVSVVFIDVCDSITPAKLLTDRGIIPQQAWAQIGICFNGSGDLYTQYGMSTQVAFAKNITTALSSVNSLYDKNNKVLIYPIADYFYGNVFIILIILNSAQ